MAFRNDSGGSGTTTGAGLGKVAAKAVKRTAKSTRRASSNRATSQAQPRRRISSSSGGSSRRSSGSSGGGGGRSYSPPKKTAPKPPSLADYLGTDSVYQQSVRGGKRSLADFLSELGRRRGEAGTQFTQTKSGMERDRVQQLEDLRNEFASRGLIQSGLYGEEQGKFQQTFMQQMQALEQQQAALLADIMSQETNYKRENELAMEQARQEAIARRASKYKIGA